MVKIPPPHHVFNFFIHNILCFNYIANVIKLMRKSLGDERWDMLGRRTCRDMRGYAGRTTSPKSARPGCRFWSHPPRLQRLGDRNGKRSTSRKKNDYFVFNLLIVNHINQYFNIRLHLIIFIIYNR